MNSQKFEEFMDHCINALPKDLLGIKHDIEKQLRVALAAAFRKMDLVTREEFDVQSKLLARTREQLDTMQKRLSQMEQKKLDRGTRPAEMPKA